MIRDHGDQALSWIEEVGGKIARVYPTSSKEGLVIALERISRLVPLFYRGGETIPIESLASDVSLENLALNHLPDNENEFFNSMIAEWLRFYGPLSEDDVLNKLGLEKEALFPAVEDLVELDILTKGQLITHGPGDDICDRENFSRLLRLARAEARPVFDPLAVDNLPLFMADVQEVLSRRHGIQLR